MQNRRLAGWKKRIFGQKHSVGRPICILLVSNLHAIDPQRHTDWRVKAMLLTKNLHQTHPWMCRKIANYWLPDSYKLGSFWPYLQRPSRLLANKQRSERLVVKKIQHHVSPLLLMRLILATMAWASSLTTGNNIKKVHLMKFKCSTATIIRIFR